MNAPSALEGPPIRDPFARWESDPPPDVRPPTRLGTASLVAGVVSLLLGPLAGVPAVVMGLLARGRDSAASRARARATAGIVLGVTFSIVWPAAVGVGLLVAGARPDEHRGRPTVVRDDPGSSTRGTPLAAPGPGGTVPQDTVERAVGTLVIVDVGVQEDSLEAALRAQAALAQGARQTLLVTTTRSGCEPCDGLVASLDHPLMQEALDSVRLVRVDIDVFGEDLNALRMPSDTIPGFFLLKEDLTPRDWIHGGEWGLDVAVNIAPVLGPFVRGQLQRREHVWHLPAATPRRSRPSPPTLPPPTGPPASGPGAASRPGGGIWL